MLRGLCRGTRCATSLTATPGPAPAWSHHRNARHRAACKGSDIPHGTFCTDLCTTCGQEPKVRSLPLPAPSHALVF
eukprot:1467643-Heterocapsa_arctica.AAC.1